MKKLVFGIIATILLGSLSYSQTSNSQEILKTSKSTISLRQVQNNNDIPISFSNNLVNFPKFNMNARYEITFVGNNYKAYSFRQLNYNVTNKSNYCIFFLADSNNRLIDTLIQQDETLNGENKSIKILDLDGKLVNDFIYNSKNDNFVSQTISPANMSQYKMSVGGCTKKCVEAIYDYDTWGGLTLIAISAFQPETLLAVLVGCRIGCS